MKNRILFSFALAMMASSSFAATGIADTTQVHGINEVVVTGSNQATSRNIFGFGVSNGGSGGIKLRGVGGSPTSGILIMVDGLLSLLDSTPIPWLTSMRWNMWIMWRCCVDGVINNGYQMPGFTAMGGVKVRF